MVPGLFPAEFRRPEGTVAVYFETAAVITALVLLGKVLEEGVLQIAASVETASEHPLARAIVDAASRRGIALAAVSGCDSPTGKGVGGTVEGAARSEKRRGRAASPRGSCRRHA